MTFLVFQAIKKNSIPNMLFFIKLFFHPDVFIAFTFAVMICIVQDIESNGSTNMTTVTGLHTLKDLHRLLKKGLITEEEYNSSRARIMSTMLNSKGASLTSVEVAAEMKEDQCNHILMLYHILHYFYNLLIYLY